ncbi:single-stranded-DNA-specific exonuclease RecJ [Phormidium tenue]|uniref:Single-stranded-DNA-specific exonuclease RecJ n=1 Tax=Phormidium tenue NIES-30 TaxID=549789 RepID=A0A1U7JBD6_9CYAN|nr:single-stranded-DNA-specific exonuclease RecJ [Phormidium tenue]MBD2230113.1 single-stranded-DNA-specific exonuclease RecJ [Phormidium tenue FACHB-1052]OKH51055.1 single-stranded-DNA-specific exonuclease RecJ [Phormidium tenue NIES-30]
MDALPLRWNLPKADAAPDSWVETVAQATPGTTTSRWLAQVLWQRQIGFTEPLEGWLNPALYQPTPASALGPAMAIAVSRLQQAIATEEKVAIWGDFDADGVTATAVLWDGLGQLIPKGDRLTYFIPNRLSESHGLSRRGLDHLADWGATLVVTCDTGSTSGAEIAYAKALGLEVIVTDHHTLPEVDIGAIALINPRSLPPEHPLATLSGVAVAYKLLEGLYAALDSPPPLPLDHVLDLVAIGLIADLVELRGDCRYLAQIGLARLQTQTQPNPPYPRPGLAELLALCKRTGDRPTDISFGLGPRINAVSRIHGDASFCVELLTSRDRDSQGLALKGQHTKTLAYEAELANTRRKALQRDLYGQVMARVAQVDLATTRCLVLADETWPTGILGLVAGQVAQALGRPTILLRIDSATEDGSPGLARGSARSVAGLDLYQLFQAQSALLTGFGGHPLAAGLTLPVEHIEVLAAALNRMVREQLGGNGEPQPQIQIDLTVTVADLGQPLFRELKWLEPCGMGNPVPKLLLSNVWFQNAFHKKLRDRQNKAVSFIKTEFELWDDAAEAGFPGEWWGHYRDELPPGRSDVVVELDFNSHTGYHVKLIDVRPTAVGQPGADPGPSNSVLDGWQHAAQAKLPLALAFSQAIDDLSPGEVWQELVGLAKYLARTQTPVTRSQLSDRLRLSPTSLALGLAALETAGFEITPDSHSLAVAAPEQDILTIQFDPDPTTPTPRAVQPFLDVLQEEQFRRRYFAQVPVTALS